MATGARLTRNLLLLDLLKEGLLRLDQELFDTQIALGVVCREIPEFLNEALCDFTVRVGKLDVSVESPFARLSRTDSIALLRGDEAPFSSTIELIESKLDTRECIEKGRFGAPKFRPSIDCLASKYGSGASRPPFCLLNCLLAAARKLS